MLLYEKPSLEDRSPQPWPLNAPLSDFVVSRDALDAPPPDDDTLGVVVSAPKEVAALRDLRRRYSRLYPEHITPTDVVAVEHDGVIYALVARDVLPP